MRDIRIYAAIIGFTWLAFLISWAILAMTIGGSGRRYYSPAASGARLAIVVLLFLAVRYNGWVDVQPFGDRARDVAAAGAALCVAGFAFALWARVALGRNWGMPMTLHENPKLVTAGPYRLVRHPIYTGLSGMLIGTTLVYPLAALPCAIAIGYSVLSALREERDMEQRFPAAYPDYRKRSKMLVPFLF